VEEERYEQMRKYMRIGGRDMRRGIKDMSGGGEI
jgi:hypothetical protein